jgi:hypothetical protein
MPKRPNITGGLPGATPQLFSKFGCFGPERETSGAPEQGLCVSGEVGT